MTQDRHNLKPVEWVSGRVRFLDQTLLPSETHFIETDDEAVLAEAIQRLAIRAAPLIGIAAAYGMVLAVQKVREGDHAALAAAFQRASLLFASTRPTAANLFWALNRLKRLFEKNRERGIETLQTLLLQEALAIHEEDRQMCERIGRFGAELLTDDVSILTHCNTGRLATGGIGTALGIITTAAEQRKLKHVYIDETRPLLQGARLTAWELSMSRIPATLIVDSAAGVLMEQGLVDAVIVGADRIAANGDVANKIGTYGLAVLAHYHKVPMYVAAPTTTVDYQVPSGAMIPIEHRSPAELSQFFETGPRLDVEVYNPAFDVTPHELISAIITERGVMDNPNAESMSAWRSAEVSA